MQKIRYWKSILLIGLTSCVVGPKYVEPEVDVPANWQSPPSEGMVYEDPNRLLWWESLNDPLLNSLIQHAARQNLDLFIAGTRILQARAERKGKEAEKYPHIDASITPGHVYFSKDALVNGVLGSVSHRDRDHSVKRNVNFFEIGFDAEWEIDLFGLNKHQVNALQAKVEASKESLCDCWVSLSAEIARYYVELRSFQQRLKLLEKNLEFQQEAIYLTQQLMKIDSVSAFEVLQAEEQLSTLLSQKPLLEVAIHKAIHHISILLGQVPGELFCELYPSKELPYLPFEKPIGLPSELLRRRPDIRKAERNLAAATESVGSAVAALFPRISLYGFVGSISTQLKNLVNSSGATWLAAPQLLQPLFNSRLLQEDVEFNRIQARAALFEYQKIVLTSLEEVENSLASFHYELNHHTCLIKIKQNREMTFELTMQLYERGIKDYLEVLTASRSILTAEDQIIQSQKDLLLHYISLYKALGGGWDIAQGACEEEKINCH